MSIENDNTKHLSLSDDEKTVDIIQGNVNTFAILFKSNETVENDLRNNTRNDISNQLNNFDSSTTDAEYGKEIEAENEKRTAVERLFGKLNKGSLRGSIFSMVTTALGTGCLALPRYVNVLSIGLSFILAIISALGILMNLYFLSKASAKTKIYDYPDLTEKILSKRWKMVVNIGSIVYLVGAMIVYQVMVYRMISTVYYDFFISADEYGVKQELVDFLQSGFLTELKYKYPVNFGIALIILFPLSLINTLEDFRIASMVGTGCLLSLMLVSIFY